MLDKSFLKELRQDTADQGYTVKHEYGNWASEAVMKNMDIFLKKKNPDLGLTFDKFVEMSYTKQNNSYDFHDQYISEYLLLDMLGYCSDKLKKKSNNFQNIIADAMHSFYASHCDYLVTIDKNLIEKSRVLYSKYNVGTKIISPEAMVGEISRRIESEYKKESFFSHVFEYCQDANCVAEGKNDIEGKTETLVFELPTYHFNYYNYLIQRYYSEENIVLFTFKQDIQGFTNFHYFAEMESVFDSITEFFGYDDFSDLNSTRRDYIYSDKNISLHWTFEGGKICLDKDEDTKKSVLTYLFEVDKIEKKSNRQNTL